MDTLPVIEPLPFKFKVWRQDKSLPIRCTGHAPRSTDRDDAANDAANQEVERQAADYRRTTISEQRVTCPKAFTPRSARRDSHPKFKACWSILQTPIAAAQGDGGKEKGEGERVEDEKINWSTSDGFIPKPEREKATLDDIQNTATVPQQLLPSSDEYAASTDGHQAVVIKSHQKFKRQRLHPKRKQQQHHHHSMLERSKTFCYGDSNSYRDTSLDLSPTTKLRPSSGKLLNVHQAGVRYRRNMKDEVPSRVASPYRLDKALPLVDVASSLDLGVGESGSSKRKTIIERHLSDRLAVCKTQLKDEKRSAAWLSWHNPYRPANLPPVSVIAKTTGGGVTTDLSVRPTASMSSQQKQHKQRRQDTIFYYRPKTLVSPRSPKDVAFGLGRSKTNIEISSTSSRHGTLYTSPETSVVHRQSEEVISTATVATEEITGAGDSKVKSLQLSSKCITFHYKFNKDDTSKSESDDSSIDQRGGVHETISDKLPGLSDKIEIKEQATEPSVNEIAVSVTATVSEIIVPPPKINGSIRNCDTHTESSLSDQQQDGRSSNLPKDAGQNGPVFFITSPVEGSSDDRVTETKHDEADNVIVDPRMIRIIGRVIGDDINVSLTEDSESASFYER